MAHVETTRAWVSWLALGSDLFDCSDWWFAQARRNHAAASLAAVRAARMWMYHQAKILQKTTSLRGTHWIGKPRNAHSVHILASWLLARDCRLAPLEKTKHPLESNKASSGRVPVFVRQEHHTLADTHTQLLERASFA